MIRKFQYYLFINNLQLIILSRSLMLIVPYLIFIESPFLVSYTEDFTEKYLMWKYGSLENLGLLSESEVYYLMKKIFSVSLAISFFLIYILFLYVQISTFRTSFKKYSIHRTHKMFDDIGFAVTFSSLLILYNYPLQSLFNSYWYKFIAVYFVYSFIFCILINTNAYGYSVRRRYKPLKT